MNRKGKDSQKPERITRPREEEGEVEKKLKEKDHDSKKDSVPNSPFKTKSPFWKDCSISLLVEVKKDVDSRVTNVPSDSDTLKQLGNWNELQAELQRKETIEKIQKELMSRWRKEEKKKGTGNESDVMKSDEDHERIGGEERVSCKFIRNFRKFQMRLSEFRPEYGDQKLPGNVWVVIRAFKVGEGVLVFLHEFAKKFQEKTFFSKFKIRVKFGSAEAKVRSVEYDVDPHYQVVIRCIVPPLIPQGSEESQVQGQREAPTTPECVPVPVTVALTGFADFDVPTIDGKELLYSYLNKSGKVKLKKYLKHQQ